MPDFDKLFSDACKELSLEPANADAVLFFDKIEKAWFVDVTPKGFYR